MSNRPTDGVAARLVCTTSTIAAAPALGRAGEMASRNSWGVSLIAAYWEESTPHARRLFLDEAAGRDAGCVTYDFNVFE